MRKTRRSWLILTLVIAGALFGLAGPRPVADACSVAGPSPMGALLGVSVWTTTEEAPANAASLDPARGDRFVSAGATLYRIAPGTTEVDAGSDVIIPLSETPDSVPPTMELTGAVWVEESGCSGCAYGGSDISNVTLDVIAEDDVATAARITYAVYFGATESEATAASEGEPDLWVLPTEGTELRVWFFMNEAELSEFVVVRAYDQAGNASSASAPVPITRA